MGFFKIFYCTHESTLKYIIYAEIMSPYFSHMKELLVAGIVLGDVDVSNLRKSTAKSLYTSFTTSFPPPKIVYKCKVRRCQE